MFRVDKGFVAQIADAASGRRAPLDATQAAAAALTLPLETAPFARHDARGLLSLARHDDPHSGGSSFSIMLAPAPHLDGAYAVFGRVVGRASFAALASIEAVPVRREGIFVMPVERVGIEGSYVHAQARGKGGGEPESGALAATATASPSLATCERKLEEVRARLRAAEHAADAARVRALP